MYIYGTQLPGLLAIPLSVPLAHEHVVEVLSACENILFFGFMTFTVVSNYNTAPKLISVVWNIHSYFFSSNKHVKHFMTNNIIYSPQLCTLVKTYL